MEAGPRRRPRAAGRGWVAELTCLANLTGWPAAAVLEGVALVLAAANPAPDVMDGRTITPFGTLAGPGHLSWLWDAADGFGWVAIMPAALISLVVRYQGGGEEPPPGGLRRSRELLSDLRLDASAAIADIRRLVYALRPPALDDMGLVSSLRQEATRVARDRGGSPMAVEVTAVPALPRLPAAVEAAAYRIVVEAMANATRHARGRANPRSLATTGQAFRHGQDAN